MKTMQTITMTLSLIITLNAGKFNDRLNEVFGNTVKTSIANFHEIAAKDEETNNNNIVCTVPARPGPISGSPVACFRVPTTYFITPVPGATSYTWKVIGGAIIGSSKGTKITVNWSWSAQSVSVKAVNSCGSSPSSSLAISGVINCTTGVSESD